MSPKSSRSSIRAPLLSGTSSPAGNLTKAQIAKLHRRSRSGCFTCRLRRKKCDEATPMCRACQNLGLCCEYKRPDWWSDNGQRRQQKDAIKDVIKAKKLAEKPSKANKSQPGADTPPSLCYSLPTSDTHSEALARTRGASPESQYSPEFSFDTPQDYFNLTPMPPPGWAPAHHQYPHCSPFEVDVKTERQMFVNDVPTRKDSTTCTFSTFAPPPSSHGSVHTFSSDHWVHQEFYQHHSESFTEEPLDFNFFDFPHDPITPSHEAVIAVNECDQHLLQHFFQDIVPSLFPILDINQHCSVRTDIVLPALATNKCYLHCCLSASALHMKVTQSIKDEQIDHDIMRHRGETISTLCEALGDDTDHATMLEATLAMIFLQGWVGSPDDGLPDIPWHQHFQAAADLVNRLDLPRHLVELDYVPRTQLPFNMTLAAWIDILGATMMGRVPVFAHTYREKNLHKSASGLSELMGCDDETMYLISEIACLEALKLEGMDDLTLCTHIKMLGDKLTESDPGLDAVASVYKEDGTHAIRPAQLSKNITAVFRLAARIYLCSLVPDFDKHQQSIMSLVEALTSVMDFIPSGPGGFDRSLVWPLLITGSVSVEDSNFRKTFLKRSVELGEGAKTGSFSKMSELLHDVWAINADGATNGETQNVHWRDVMLQKEWDFLLI